MPMLDIPDAYWTIAPRGFPAVVAPYRDGLAAIGVDLVTGAAPVLDGNDAGLLTDLGNVDGDQHTIRTDAGANMAALSTTPTGDALSASTVADGKVTQADGAQGFSVQYQPAIPFTPTGPPDVPPDVQNATGTDQQGVISPSSTDTGAAAVEAQAPASAAVTAEAETPPPIEATPEATPTGEATPPAEAPAAPAAPVIAPEDQPVTVGQLAAVLSQLDLTFTLMV